MLPIKFDRPALDSMFLIIVESFCRLLKNFPSTVSIFIFIFQQTASETEIALFDDLYRYNHVRCYFLN